MYIFILMKKLQEFYLKSYLNPNVLLISLYYIKLTKYLKQINRKKFILLEKFQWYLKSIKLKFLLLKAKHNLLKRCSFKPLNISSNLLFFLLQNNKKDNNWYLMIC